MDSGIEALRSQLREAVEECSARGLVFSTKWAAEQLCNLPPPGTAAADSLEIDTEEGGMQVGAIKSTPTLKHRLRGAGRAPQTNDATESDTALDDKHRAWQQLDADERDRVALGKSLFDVREFERAAFMLTGCHGPRAVFLRLYSLYLNSERRASEAGESKISNSSAVAEISAELLALDAAGDLDGFG
ncbi:Anaphase-promoting complex subunit 8, partial [Coemansia sp. RSA 2671]